MPRFLLLLACVLPACATADDGASTVSDSAGFHDSTASDSGPATDSGATSDADTSTDDTTTTTDTGTETATSDSTTSDVSGGDGASDAPPTDPTCAAMATNTDCQTCCLGAHTDAYNAFAAAVTTCVCMPAVCQAACAASVCAAPPTGPDPTCLSCLTPAESGACKPAIDAVCAKPSGTCYPFAECVITSNCTSKP